MSGTNRIPAAAIIGLDRQELSDDDKAAIDKLAGEIAERLIARQRRRDVERFAITDEGFKTLEELFGRDLAIVLLADAVEASGPQALNLRTVPPELTELLALQNETLE